MSLPLTDKMTVFVLFFGNHPELATRCLTSLERRLDMGLVDSVRVGLNAVCPATEDVVNQAADRGLIKEQHIYQKTGNAHKYPMMREMFNDPDNPITTKYVMWFDDDSFIRDAGGLAEDWTSLVLKQAEKTGLLGTRRYIRLGGAQAAWAQDQPWYRANPVLQPQDQVRFSNGAWWVTKTTILRELDYPWAELDHRGGDVMLGVAMQQLGYEQTHFTAGVAINADQTGAEDKSPRRGFNQKPLGWDYDPGVAKALVTRAGAAIPAVVDMFQIVDGPDADNV
jgi:hypothetical protein